MTGLLNRLTMLQKLLLLSASFALPILVLASYMLAGLQREIQATDREIFGTRYLESLGELMGQVARRQGQAQPPPATGSPAATGGADWAGRSAEIWKRLEGIDRQKATVLGSASAGAAGGQGALSLDALRAVWSRARLEAPAAAGQAGATPFEVISAIEAAIASVGDASNLILDPDLDTFSLVEVTVRALPRLQARLSSLLADAALRDLRHRLSFQERAQLLVWAAVLREEGERVAGGVARALDANARLGGATPSLQQVLPPAVQTFAIELETLVLFLGEIAKPDGAPQEREALDRFALSVSDQGFAVWSASLGELQKLLSLRRALLAQRRLTAVLATLAALAVSGLLIVLIIRNITRPLDLLVGSARRIATGDLSGVPELARRDEIGTLGQSVATMTRGLASLVGKVQGASVQMASTATELAAASRQQEGLVSDLGASTSKVAVAVSQISTTSQELARAMQRVQEVAGDTEQLADAGRSGLAEMERMMRRLLEATDAVSSGLASIHAQANTVGAVITTMTKVADQTNLLSLNASIEAERMGQQGRGFAVVAREIRRLADQTAVATLDIERMVAEMHAAVAAGVREVQAFAETMRRGVETSAGVGQRLAEIIARVKELTPQVESVSAGVQAQSAGTGEISQAMAELDQGARQSADSLRHFNEAADHVREAARNLRSEVEGFRVS